MPRLAKELGPLDVKRLQHPGRGRNVKIAVGGVAGLVMQITPSGARTWLLRTMVGGKRRAIGLGGYPTVTLAQARERAREALDKIRRGVDPVEERKATRARLAAEQKRGLLFKDAVHKFLEAKWPELSAGNAKHAAQWESTLANYAVPLIGRMRVQDITNQDVLRVLQQDVRDKGGELEGALWVVRNETARRLRQRVEAILSWATVAGHRAGDNPARLGGNLDQLLPKASKVASKDNQPAVALADAARWFADLRTRDGIAARALEFLAMTAARSGEVRGATWDEFDLDAGLWTIPAARMKAGNEHRVPLTAEAVALVKAMPKVEKSPYVFAAPRGGMLSDMSISAVMRRQQAAEEKAGRPGYLDRVSGRPAVPHGVRSTFSDWAAERTNFPREMAELALAHNVGSEVERAYRRGDMIEKRRAMMAAWSRFLRGEQGAKVVAIGEVRG